ncbi:AAA family ATPase [Paenibacillus sp. NEAU-GSW1]|uniref:AAA family ATPase n=1 Tax=Paenibacillus sp. NEAU-GSW1 TaxID=2682486 RepID=UPI0012E0ED04|nr:AAA family ATPase [Paenibacillus sp. NEAU-GSW1]MUT66851.1 hypothetical protein [Paenibacillus sp. NEAU-GSW1]
MELRLTSHPHINAMIRLFEQEKQPFRKIHRMIDLFETIIKTHTAVLIGNYFHYAHISDAIKGYLANGLRTPSLGLWQDFSRTVADELALNYITEEQWESLFGALPHKEQKEKFKRVYLKLDERYVIPASDLSWMRKIYSQLEHGNYAANDRFFIRHFYSYFREWDNQEVDKVISTRNHYAHGATPGDHVCEQNVQSLLPILRKWLDAEWLKETTIAVFANNGTCIEAVPLEGNSAENSFKLPVWDNLSAGDTPIVEGVPYLVKATGEVLNLFPIMVAKRLEGDTMQSISFFNDLKKKHEVAFLNYPSARHHKDKAIYPIFQSYFQIEAWRSKVTEEFKERIDQLTETFKGRKAEIDSLLSYLANKTAGYVAIVGNPGFGKSAILARATQLADPEQYYIVKYFIRRGTQSKISYLLDYLHAALERICPLSWPAAVSIEEKQEQLHKRLLHVSEQLKEKKLAIFIDGLDELDGLGGLLTSAYPNVIVVYASRYTAEFQKFYSLLPIEHKWKEEIGGLNQEDIRALLYEVTNKYEIRQQYIDTIAVKSAGNPLFLKLLCDAVSSGHLKLNQIDSLPQKIEDFYQDILDRIGMKEHGAAILDALYVIAAANDNLSPTHMERILGMDTVLSATVFNVLQEILTEHAERKYYYQLFHESLRDFLKQYRPQKLVWAQLQLVNYCANWDAFEAYEEELLRYPLLHYSTHLLQLNKKSDLYEIATNRQYINKQIQVTKRYDHSFQLLRQALQATMEDEGREIAKAIRLLSELGTLHVALSNRIGMLLDRIDRPGFEDIDVILQQIKNYEDHEQTVLYLQLMASVVSNQSDDQKRKMLDKILGQVEETRAKAAENLGWSLYSSLAMLVPILEGILAAGSDPSPFVQGIRLDHYEGSEAEALLNSVLTEHPHLKQAISGLWNANDGSPRPRRRGDAYTNGVDEEEQEDSLYAEANRKIKDGDISGAMLTIKQIPNDWDKHQTIAYRWAGALCGLQRWNEAIEIVSWIPNEVPENELIVVGLIHIAGSLIHHGQYEKAIQLANGMDELNLSRSELVRGIALHLADAGEFDSCLSMIDQIPDIRFRIPPLTRTIVQMIKLGLNERAEAVLSETISRLDWMKDKGKRKDELRLMIRTVSEAYANLGKNKEALTVLSSSIRKDNKLSDNKSFLLRLLETAHSFVSQSKGAEAKEAIAVAAEYLETMSDHWQRDDFYVKFSNLLWSIGEPSESNAMALRVKDHYKQIDTVAPLLSKPMKAEHIPSLTERISYLQDVNQRSRYQFMFVEKLIRNGRMEQASEVTETIADLECRNKARSTIETGNAPAGSKKFIPSVELESEFDANEEMSSAAALIDVDQSIERALAIPDFNHKAGALLDLSAVLYRKGHKERAFDLVKLSAPLLQLHEHDAEDYLYKRHFTVQWIEQLAQAKRWDELIWFIQTEHLTLGPGQLIDCIFKYMQKGTVLEFLQNVAQSGMSGSLSWKIYSSSLERAYDPEVDSLEFLLTLAPIVSHYRDLLTEMLIMIVYYTRFANEGRLDYREIIETIEASLTIPAPLTKTIGPQHTLHNLAEWLPAIADEDDRSEIEIWARRTANGKMTTEQFNQSIAPYVKLLNK